MSNRSETRGIYILANDAMVNQLIALLNSLRVHDDLQLRVCVIPYDDATNELARVMASYPNVFLWSDANALAHWENFANAAWALHPRALPHWHAKYGTRAVYRLAMHRRFVAFDGPFAQFLYLDADMLVLDSLAPFFAALEQNEFVVYDDQYRAPQHVFDMQSPRVYERFGKTRVHTEIFCAGLFASKQNVLHAERQARVLTQLGAGDAEMLYVNAPDQSLLNYAALALPLTTHNLYRAAPESRRIRTCATVEGLQEKNRLVFDRARRLPFLHYIGIPAWAFHRVCDGEDVRFPYRETFLRYRYLDAPAARPRLRGKPVDVLHRPSKIRRGFARSKQRAKRLLRL
jgi:hypothetical protein